MAGDGNDYFSDDPVDPERSTGRFDWAELESFDYGCYFESIGETAIDDPGRREYMMRTMALFLRDWGRGETPPESVMATLAVAFTHILDGEQPNDQFPLPWRPSGAEFSGKQLRNIALCAEVRSILRAAPQRVVTEVLREVAGRRHVSYESAVAIWYAQPKSERWTG